MPPSQTGNVGYTAGYTRSAAALLYARLQRSSHTGRHLPIGVHTAVIEIHAIARRVSRTDAFLDLRDLVVIDICRMFLVVCSERSALSALQLFLDALLSDFREETR